MNDIKIITNTNEFGERKSLFKIRIKSGFAYMEIGKGFLGDMDFGGPDKLIIDSNKFLELWKNDPYKNERKLAFGNESVWRNDYNFHYAEAGFSHGVSNPVPLDYIHCYLSDVYDSFSARLINSLTGRKKTEKKRPYCTFTNGITRTIWLLANGAVCFPVMTDKMSFDLLRLHAGIHESEKLLNLC